MNFRRLLDDAFGRSVHVKQTEVTGPVQIICGDCAGHDLIAKPTFLAIRAGVSCCGRCGGLAYVLRSDLARRLTPTEVLDRTIADLAAASREVV